MKQYLLFIVVLLTFTLVSPKEEQVTCFACKELITYVQAAVSQNINLNAIYSNLTYACNYYSLTSFCNTYIMPQVEEIFWGFRSDQTPSMVCQRINLCVFTITSITGTIFYAQGFDLWNTSVVQVGSNQPYISTVHLATITKNPIAGGQSTGISCGPIYCAVVQKGTDPNNGQLLYSLSTFMGTSTGVQNLYTDIFFEEGPWYGPWYDFNTDEFWIAHGPIYNITIGIYDLEYKQYAPKSYLSFDLPFSSTILSAAIINRVLYFTFTNDNHISAYDLALRLYRGNYSTPVNSMLAANPVTKELYGYSPSAGGVWKYNNDWTRTSVLTLASFKSQLPIASADIDPTKNRMWINYVSQNHLIQWFIIDLTNPGNYMVVNNPPNVLFGFNPESVTTVEE